MARVADTAAVMVKPLQNASMLQQLIPLPAN